MLRWRQSTRHILDAYDRNIATKLWQQSVPIAYTFRKASEPYSTGTSKNSTHLHSVCADTSPGGNTSRKTTRPKLQTVPFPSNDISLSRRTVLPPMSKGLKRDDASTSRPQPSMSSKPSVRSSINRTQHSPNTVGQRVKSNDRTVTEAACALEDILYRPSTKEPSESGLLQEYRKLSTQSLSHHISRPFFSDLVAVCGSLCLVLAYAPRKLNQGTLTPLFGRQIPSSTDLANFVVDVMRDMGQLGLTGRQDLFWLSQVKGVLDAAGNSHQKSRRQALLRAIRSQCQHYLNDSTTTKGHVTYISVLLSTNQPELVEEAAKSYILLLESSTEASVSYAEVFWQLVSPRSTSLSDATRQRLCVAALRLAQRPATQILSPSDDAPLTGISNITRAFTAALFPGLDVRQPTDPVRSWASSQVLQALSPTLTLDTRWQNLSLLSLAMSPGRAATPYQGPTTASSSVMWRTTLILDALSHMLGASERDNLEFPLNVQKIGRNLWELFTTAPTSEQPTEVNLACVSAFLRLAALSRDEELFVRCSDMCRRLRLWTFSTSDSPSVRRQVLDVVVAFSVALKAWKRLNWLGLFRTLAQNFDDNVQWEGSVSDALIQHYTHHDVDAAVELYRFCQNAGIRLPDRSHVPLALALVRAERWGNVPQFLNDLVFKPQDVELVVVALMRHYQQRRCEHADPDLMNILSRRVVKMYEDSPPPSHLKYPIRYFLSMLIWSGHGPTAMRLVRILRNSANDFFSPHLLRRLASQLVSKRQFTDAVKLREMFKDAPDLKRVRSIHHIGRKLVSKFADSGLFRLALRLPRSRRKQSTLPRERLARISIHRQHAKMRLYFAQVRPLIAGATSDGPTIRDAVSLLVKHGRMYAARKLYAKYQVGIDAKTHTAIGNIILHGPITGSKLRNGRLVRNVLRMKERLIADCGFVPDRATSNILIKAMLRWTAMFTAARVRQLFDTMVREGYPVPDRWRRQPHNVPFNTVSAQSGGFGIPASATINFNRHTRPMYKMFIKAFYLRKDVVAAKAVVGMLKEVQAEVVAEREKRSRARREGIIKKRLREEKKSQGKTS